MVIFIAPGTGGSSLPQPASTGAAENKTIDVSSSTKVKSNQGNQKTSGSFTPPSDLLLIAYDLATHHFLSHQSP
jgi:hypothetical protein